MQSHSKHPHVFVLVRIDAYQHVLDENAVMVLKVFEDKASAEADAQRLNALNAQKDCKYFVQSAHWIDEK